MLSASQEAGLFLLTIRAIAGFPALFGLYAVHVGFAGVSGPYALFGLYESRARLIAVKSAMLDLR
jgi:hypothetical protein